MSEVQREVGQDHPLEEVAEDAPQRDDVVFITVHKSDREWINKTKSKGQNREDRLHEVIKLFRKQILGEKVEV